MRAKIERAARKRAGYARVGHTRLLAQFRATIKQRLHAAFGNAKILQALSQTKSTFNNVKYITSTVKCIDPGEMLSESYGTVTIFPRNFPEPVKFAAEMHRPTLGNIINVPPILRKISGQKVCRRFSPVEYSFVRPSVRLFVCSFAL